MKVAYIAAIAAILLLAGCTARPPVMTDKQAAARYLSLVAPLNKAIDNSDAAGDDGYVEFHHYAPATRSAFLKADKELGSAATWPVDTQSSVKVLKSSFEAWASTMQAYADAPNDAAAKKVKQPDEAQMKNEYRAAAELRRALNLPSNSSTGGL